MDKSELLTSITALSTQNLITKEEIVNAFERGKKQKTSALTRELGVSEVLYFIGGFIVFIGISVLIGQNWDTLNFFTKLLTTLGFGTVAYFLGVILNKEERYGLIGHAFHFIAALVLPLGLAVLLDRYGRDPTGVGAQSLISAVLFIAYLSSYFLFKKTVFTFFSIAYATWFFMSFTNFLIGTNPLFAEIKFYEYRFLLVGLSYLLLGYHFSLTQEAGLTGALYTFGNLFFLGAALALGGWEPNQNLFWELLFPGLIFAVLLLSVKLKSKAFLTFGTIFLMIYILKITGEYFTDSLGWPLSLMICGVALIGIGYYAFTLNKRYLSLKQD